MDVNPLEPFMTNERIRQVIRDEETKKLYLVLSSRKPSASG
jgi:hypothetical protein